MAITISRVELLHDFSTSAQVEAVRRNDPAEEGLLQRLSLDHQHT